MDVSILDLLVLGLACFRLTRLLVYDRITTFIRSPFMEEMEEIGESGQKEIYLVPKKGVIKGFFGELLSCYWCTGIWSAIGILIFYYVAPLYAVPVIMVLAVAGIGALIETFVQKIMQ
ncbi:DUF1360 domain-containing protein [Bacillus benzoevorans]|uniref:DUF1360 domain-containing protein n=1 Tax=Bacillus benzoevorans TaxID=1456 RepID=A0A7X0LUS9_9BACI|nr:DUF1360 domain-containing protein [Bacillus benzoevorans]MBB6443564.1 hypothetical protein [Bacillus benzoevorans]